MRSPPQSLPVSAAADGLHPGFVDPVLDAQRVFRRVLEAMAHPGAVLTIDVALDAPSPLSMGCAALCLALVDSDTPLWLDAEMSSEPVLRYLRFHCGARPAASSCDARFALIADGNALPPLQRFSAGDDEFPERSTTLVIQVQELEAGQGRCLTGPGIERETRLWVAGLRPDFWAQWRENHALFPCGVDVVFVAGNRIAALPRTTDAKG